MASTYSNLKVQLMATGENAGTWGNVTNENLGTALEQAIVETATVTFASANVTLTLTDTNAKQDARALRLNLTGTTGGARDLIVPAIEKPYIVNNGTADTITVKVSGQTGVAVPASKTILVYNNGTDVVDAVNHLSSLSLNTALPIASGGTGSNTATFSGANITSLNASNISSGSLNNARTTASSSNGASTIVARDASGNFSANVITANGSSITAINASNISTGTLANARTTASSSNGASTIVARGASGEFSAGTITANLTGTASNATVLQTARTIGISGGATGTATSFNGSANITIPVTAINVSTATAGTLAVARGGTAASTLTAENVIIGNGTSAVKFVAPGTSGNVLTSNGTAWASTALPAGGVTSLNGQTGAITNTSVDAIGSYAVAFYARNNVTTTANRYSYVAVGSTVAGSSLRYSSGADATNVTTVPTTFDTLEVGDSIGSETTTFPTSGVGTSSTLSGTWRKMAYRYDSNKDGGCNHNWRAALWVRVS